MDLEVNTRSLLRWRFDVEQGGSRIADIDLRELKEGAAVVRIQRDALQNHPVRTF